MTTFRSFGSIPQIDLEFANITDFESLPTSAGWYGWVYVAGSTSPNELSILRQIRPEATVDHYFHMSLRGTLTPEEISTDIGPLSEQAINDFRSLHFAFAPCIYIGISRNLKRRLKSHRKHIQQEYSLLHTHTESDPAAPELDTERESEFFGRRVASLLRRVRANPDNLYVKYALCADETVLKPLETAMNITFAPTLGRRP